MRIDVLTIFPEIFGPALSSSILGRAACKGVVSYHIHDIRDYTTDRHRSVDDRPYGGGPGMVMKAEPIFACAEAAERMDSREPRRVLLTPQGQTFTQAFAQDLAGVERLMLICGHYEGFDERVRDGLEVTELSIGDYVLTGGEFASLVVIDAVVRLLPGALGDEESTKEESFSSSLLEYPQYTRPVTFRGMEVPEVLLSGDHERIRLWRREQSLLRTARRRADLLCCRRDPDCLKQPDAGKENQ